MKSAKTTVSIIIPTHNRVHSMKRLLDKLGSQTFPVELMEVIVVANRCTDSTISMLQNYQAPFKLHSSESSGDGAAVPRNKGASLASGSLLIFIDDDVDPSDGFVEAHMLAHRNRENVVVIGYLHFVTSPKPDYHQLEQKALWEEKFQGMRSPGYRYSYRDLLTSNFSISAELFKKTQGFVTSMHCHDDYGLGLSLINLGANFTFSKDAWGFHKDEVTDFNRSLKRKREEGKTDVKLWIKHPEVIVLPIHYNRGSKFTFLLNNDAFLLFTFFKMADVIVSCLKYLMFVLARLQLRGKWKTVNNYLHKYWYIRGFFDELHRQQILIQYFNSIPINKTPDEELEVDLKAGLTAATQLLDQVRPDSLKLRYGMQVIGSILSKPGAERLKGNHLRQILATELDESFIKSFALDEMMNTERSNCYS
jgi:glycosyltransferase involved in cell wall biosynthesis